MWAGARATLAVNSQEIVVGTPFAAVTLGTAYALAGRADKALPLVAGAVEEFLAGRAGSWVNANVLRANGGYA